MPGSLALEHPHDEVRLLASELLRDGDEDIRRRKVAVVLRDLVLDDQVIPPGVPRQLAYEAVVLVEVVTGVREDQVRFEPSLELFEDVLDLAADVREVSVPKPVDLDVDGARRGEERIGARPRLALAIPRRAQDVAMQKVALLTESFQSQRDKHWFDEELFLGLMRIRGMEAVSPTGYAEAFTCRKVSLLVA